MKKTEIDNFIKKHTFEFEKMIRDRETRKVSFPRPGFAKTAACNIQRCRDFDQDQVIVKQWTNLVDYIVEVSKT